MPVEPTAPDQESLRRDWRTFTLLVGLFYFGFAVYSGIFLNFIKESLGVEELGLGMMESMREVPGLLAALMTGTLVALAESRLAALGLAICGLGIGMTGYAGGYGPLVAITVFWSVGFHLFATVQSPITLALAKGLDSGRHLGRMNAIGAMATIMGLGFALIFRYLWSGPPPYNELFVIAGIAMVIAAALCSRLSAHAEGGVRQRIVFRREYGLFYLLTFLEGCRRQIFSIFASFALVLVYDVPVRNMLMLAFINAILIAVTAPAIGRIVDRIGERGPLIFYSVGLILVFIGYASIENVWALYALYLIDHVLFSFSIGFTTYLNRIVRPGELTPCVAMGVTMNHVAAVTVPIGGAYLWHATNDYQLPFWVGVGIATASLIATQWLPRYRPIEA